VIILNEKKTKDKEAFAVRKIKSIFRLHKEKNKTCLRVEKDHLLAISIILKSNNTCQLKSHFQLKEKSIILKKFINIPKSGECQNRMMVFEKVESLCSLLPQCLKFSNMMKNFRQDH